MITAQAEVAMRKVVGIALMMGCAVAFVADEVMEDRDKHKQTRVIINTPLSPGGPTFTWVNTDVDITDQLPFYAVLAIGTATGLLCVLWPQRRKTRLRTEDQPGGNPPAGEEGLDW
jgi:hypothetical protein